MLRHIVTWSYKERFSEAENKENAIKIKRELEALFHRIDGIIEMRVYINELSSSNQDLILNSLFESAEALADYQSHPEHKTISAFVSSTMQNRACIDYYE